MKSLHTSEFEGKAATDSTGLKAQQLADLQHYAKLCGHETLKFAPYMGAANAEKGLEDGTEPKIFIYFYHPDHASTMLSSSLGTNTYLTDMEGQPYQLFINLPFGELMAEQTGTGYQSPYKFNGKLQRSENPDASGELDPETGLYYYGARYYDPQSSTWLSVDPLAERYAGWTPYNYCYLNPIKFFDLTGMEGEDEPKSNIILIIRPKQEEYTEINNANKSDNLENWHTIVAPNIEEGNDLLKGYLKGHKVNNLVISSHGSTDGIEITKTYKVDGRSSNELTKTDLQAFSRKIDVSEEVIRNSLNALNEISSRVEQGGNLIFTSCYAGDGGFAQESFKAFNNQINYFANSWEGQVIGENSNTVQTGPLSSQYFINHFGNEIGNIDLIDDKKEPIVIHQKTE